MLDCETILSAFAQHLNYFQYSLPDTILYLLTVPQMLN
jgi:hypothetical protein